jgi:cell division protease FtsH
MVCEWGMSDLLGTVTYDERSENGAYLGANNYREKLYSEKTAQEIDAEMKRILDEAYRRALDIIKEYKDVAQLMTDMLIEFETLDAEDVKKMIERKWSPDEKRQKLEDLAQLHKKKDPASPPPPPPLPQSDSSNIEQPT